MSRVSVAVIGDTSRQIEGLVSDRLRDRFLIACISEPSSAPMKLKYLKPDIVVFAPSGNRVRTTEILKWFAQHSERTIRIRLQDGRWRPLVFLEHANLVFSPPCSEEELEGVLEFAASLVVPPEASPVCRRRCDRMHDRTSGYGFFTSIPADAET